MKRILLATITEGDFCVAHFCSSLAQSVRLGIENDTQFWPIFIRSDGNWSMAFNQVMTIAWKEKVDGIVFIHPYVSWDPPGLLGLVHTDKDAVGLPVATRTGFEVSMGEISRLQEDEETGEIKVLGCSLNFFYLSAHAITTLCETHSSVSYAGADVKLILQSGEGYSSFSSPSEVLTHRLIEQGIESWVNSKFTAHRQDLIEYTNNFEGLLKQLKGNG
jgi:hypothetical protein